MASIAETILVIEIRRMPEGCVKRLLECSLKASVKPFVDCKRFKGSVQRSCSMILNIARILFEVVVLDLSVEVETLTA